MIIVICSDCVNIKSKYVPPSIYTFKGLPLNTSITSKADKNIFIKQFEVAGELQTTKIAVYDDIKLQYYNYHQWALQLDELLTEYAVKRISNYSVFSKGIVSIFGTIPDYILEFNVNNFRINKSDKENSVEVSVLVNLHKYSSEIKDYKVFFSNTYTMNEQLVRFSLEEAITNLEAIICKIIDDALIDIIKFDISN
ncbi:MAG: ABC-type transport auxiliary lipoprotein family protein [Bacteroidetes bacterium]|nr:ABC-type transport auxiliary lipoprotein family protein [Bacteroidota bacterium]